MSPRRAFTLVELLVVVAIIGALVALLLPAVQAAREAARKSQCAGHARQMALACLNHETAQGHFPTGGWGFKWIGDPDGGYGQNQPGAWTYNILAYIEQSNLRQLGAGVADPLAQQAQLKVLVTTPLEMFNCPSKRPVQGYPIDPRFASLANNMYECRPDNDCLVARGDYRGNGGNAQAFDIEGPGPLQDLSTYRWWNEDVGIANVQTGLTFQRSLIRTSQITDGTSQTFLLGEKALSPDKYFDGSYTADDQCVYSGQNNDNQGYAGRSIDEIYPPLPDYPPRNVDMKFRFGGPHVDGFNMAMADGSVHFLAFDVEDVAFWRLAGRNDD